MYGIVGTVLCGVIIFATNNIMIAYFSLFMLGVFVSVRISVSYLYALELVSQDHKKRWNLIAACSDACVMIFIAGYFSVVKYGETTIILYVFFSCISLYFITKAPESPQFLYTKKRWKELHNSFGKISKINHSEWKGYKFDREHQVVNEFNIKQSCGDMLKDK